MAFSTSTAYAVTAFFFFLFLHLRGGNSQQLDERNFMDSDYLEFALNLEYLEAEFFLNSALGYGLDIAAPGLGMNGPQPIGAQKAELNRLIRDIIEQFAHQEVGHIRAIKSYVKGFARPQLDISAQTFNNLINNSFGGHLVTPFDPYANDINFLIASYFLPYMGLTDFVGTTANLETPAFRKMVARLLGIEAGQDAVIRTLLYQYASFQVKPYAYTVAEFTTKISDYRNYLGDEGVRDEGIIVETKNGAEGKIIGNVLAGNEWSLSYDRKPEAILKILYGTRKANEFGAFYPNGTGGNIAKSFQN